VRDLRRFLGLTFALSWGLGGLYLGARTVFPHLAPLDSGHPIFWLINCAPSLAAFVLCARDGGTAGALGLLAQVGRPFPPIWIAFALLFVPAVCALAGNLSVAALTPLLLLDLAPWGEEFGWRGYLLPRLLAYQPPLLSGLAVGAVWVVWHIPAFFIPGVMAGGWGGFLWWAAGTLSLSLIMTTLYLRAGGNLLVAGIIPHLAINAAARAGMWHSAPREVLLLLGLALGFILLCGRRPV
jgi:membrane protease YdiL (CAAX protease family)